MSGGLKHLKIETKLRGERFENVKDECVIYLVVAPDVRPSGGVGLTSDA